MRIAGHDLSKGGQRACSECHRGLAASIRNDARRAHGPPRRPGKRHIGYCGIDKGDRPIAERDIVTVHHFKVHIHRFIHIDLGFPRGDLDFRRGGGIPEIADGNRDIRVSFVHFKVADGREQRHERRSRSLTSGLLAGKIIPEVH